jgi:glyoxylate/hydroxypyruvate reductase A
MSEAAALSPHPAATSRRQGRPARKPPCVALISGSNDMSFLVPAFRRFNPSLDLRWGHDLGSLTDIEAVVCWRPPHGLLAQLPNLRLIQSSGAGVDHILDDPALPPDIPLCRAIDPAMAAGMAAYVSWAVIHHQRNMKDYLGNGIVHAWRERPIVLPHHHIVGVAGMGELGRATARALSAIGYTVRGWVRQAPAASLPGVTYFCAKAELKSFLRNCDTLVCLLPLTDETRGFLGSEVFSMLKPGAHIINVGRGAHLVEHDLLEALSNGRVGAATLDTFQNEPLPPSSRLWSHPEICITPHIASRCDPAALAAQTIGRLLAIRKGLPAEGVVDRSAGY